MTAPIHEIRALLLQFQRSDLTDVYYRSDAWTVFVARPGGAPNPVLAPETAIPTIGEVPGIAAAAPHLGLFEPLCGPGDAVGDGAVIARIDVLGRKTEVLSPAAGTVGTLCAKAGALVEFGEVLLELQPS